MTKGYIVLDLNKLTDFPWDSVYAFHGEEGGEYVNSTIGFRWDGPEVPNLHQRLLFVHKGAVVAYVDYNEEEGVSNAKKNWPLPIFYISALTKSMILLGERPNLLLLALAIAATFRVR